MKWDYTVTEYGVKIEEVKNDEVVGLIAELPINFEKEAESICNNHNKEVQS